MSEDLAQDAVEPDDDFERLKDATLGLAVILAEAQSSPTHQTVVGLKQIQGIYDALSDGMLGFAWLRDQVIGTERGDSLLQQLEMGLADKEKAVLTQLFGTPALKAD